MTEPNTILIPIPANTDVISVSAGNPIKIVLASCSGSCTIDIGSEDQEFDCDVISEVDLDVAAVPKFKVPWGSWDLSTGVWHSNPHLSMPAAQQHDENVANGYSCEHMMMIGSCPICRNRTP